MKASRFSLSRGFSLVELLAVLAALAAIGTVGYVSVRNSKSTADSIKLASDVESLNRSIQIFQNNGGSLAGLSTTDAVLTKLKTQGDSSKMLGSAGSTLDARVYAVYQTAAESSSSASRAIWSSSAGRFLIVQTGSNGVKEFRLNEDLASSAPTTDTNRTVIKEASTGNGWVWDNAPAAVASTVVGSTPVTGVAATALSVAINQNFQSGYWTIDASGAVNVNYVFREAGYASRLALFSLEGMGPDVYDLDTAAGQKAFLLEAMRRVIAGDRAQVIIDASTSSQGFNQTYTFRPGDTVAAIMIPNATFQTAYNDLNSGANNSQTYPLTSLARGTGTQAPFYANQYAPLGNNTNAYAIEDMQVTNSANVNAIDYQDLIFTASGMTAANQSMPYTISDPVAKYRADPYWNKVGTNGTLTLRQALINAGIIPANTPI